MKTLKIDTTDPLHKLLSALTNATLALLEDAAAGNSSLSMTRINLLRDQINDALKGR